MFDLFHPFRCKKRDSITEEAEYTDTTLNFDKTQRLQIKKDTDTLKVDLEKLLDEITGAHSGSHI
jgi:hypothetical protein